MREHFGKFGRIANVWIARNPPGFSYVVSSASAPSTPIHPSVLGFSLRPAAARAGVTTRCAELLRVSGG